MAETTNRFEETCGLLYEVCAMLSPPADEAEAQYLQAECMAFTAKYAVTDDRNPPR